jgi:hypothetical protein
VLVAGHDLDGARTLAAIAAPLARRPGIELIVAAMLAAETDLGATTAALAEERARSAEPMRVAAFVTRREPDDLLRLARTYNARAVVVEAPPEFAAGDPPPAAVVDLLARSPADVAIVATGRGASWAGGGVIVPFGGGENDWAALELGAWLATTTGEPLRLAGTRADPDAHGDDGSRLLADASMAVQRLVGVVAEPVLVERSAAGLADAAAGASAVVVGLSSRWRREGLGEARAALVAPGGPPVLVVHRGPQPSGIAPREAATRFTWSAAG